MICSILIPSRGNPDGLNNAVRSVGKVEGVDFWVRADADDLPTIESANALAGEFDLKLVIGQRKLGYASIGDFIQELSEQAQGEWVTMLDDDATLIGFGWEKQLETLPKTGVMALTEIFEHGGSRYAPNYGPPGWFVPNRCWEKMGEPRFMPPADAWIGELLKKWRMVHLRGITYKHVWADGRHK